MLNRIYFTSLLFFLFSCTSDQYQYSNIDYNTFQKPVKYIELDEILDEISGLEYFGNDQLICINDEVGTLFIIDLKSSEIVEKINFDVKGDFEGIACNNKLIYAITSEGLLYEINYDKNRKPQSYQIDIEGKEIESLTYYNGKIYTMTKQIDDAKEMIVYSLDPANLKSKIKKEFSIDLQTIKNFLAKDEDESILKEFTKFISGDDIYNFVRPSGIAFDQKTNHLLILSHHNRFLLETDTKGMLHKIIYLSSDKFYQPEGIAVAPDGRIYISNESRGHKPNILQFKRF